MAHVKVDDLGSRHVLYTLNVDIMKLRISAIVPIAASAAAFALAIVMLAAGTSTETANDKFWLSIDASNIGTGLIAIEPATTPTTSAATLPGLPTLPSNLPNPMQPLSDLLTGLINTTNLTGAINSGLQDLQSSVLSELVKDLNLRTKFQLYLTQACSLSGTPSRIDECTSYNDRKRGLLNITDAIPDALPLGALGTVRIPLISVLKRALGTVANLAVGGAAAMFALVIIGAVCEGLGIFLAIIAIFILTPIRPGGARLGKEAAGGGETGVIAVRGGQWDNVGISSAKRFLLRTTLFLSLLGAAALVLAAVVTTALGLVAKVAQELGDAVGMTIARGGPFLGIAWAAAVLAVLSAGYWVAVCFVEYRRTAFVRTVRSEMQVGNWRGIVREVRRNLSVKKE